MSKVFNHIVRTMIAAFILSLVCSTSGFGQKANEQLLAETTRLKKTLPSLNLSEERAKGYESDIAQAESALQSGYLFLGLYRLRSSWTSVMTLDYLREKAEIEKQGTDVFEAEHKQLGKQLDEKEKLLASKRTGDAPAAVKAIAETLLTQTRPYYQSGRLYGLNTTLRSGLAYMGRARAYMDFALFCRQLNFPSTRRAFHLRSLEPELKNLESEVLQAYRQPGATDQQPLYNIVNSTVKLAWELNEAKRFYGALHQYLEAYRHLILIKAASPDPQHLAALKERSRLLRARLEDGDSDHSIGLMYWEIAHSALDAAGDAAQEDAKLSAVILEHILPRYFQLVEEKK